MAMNTEVFPEAMLRFCAERGVDPWITTFGDVYPSLRGGSALVVNWSVLPKRAHSFLSNDFPTWSHFADTTITDLLDRPNLGVLTVQRVAHELDRLYALGSPNPTMATQVRAETADLFPVLAWSALRAWADWRCPDASTALRDLLSLDNGEIPGEVAVALDTLLGVPLNPNPAAARRNLCSIVEQHLDEREFHILSRRKWTATPETLERISESFEHTRERVRQLQNRGLRNLATLAEKNNELRWTAHHLRRTMGSIAASDAVDAAVAQIGVTPQSTEAYIALHVAGDYALHDSGLFVAGDANPDAVVEALDSLCTDDGFATTAEAEGVLASFGIRQHSYDAFLGRVARYRRIGDDWYPWRGTAADKAAAVLRSTGTSLTAQQVTDAIDEGYSTTSVQNAMSIDSRFVRTSKTHWDLAERGAPEYTGIVNNLFSALAAHGGSAKVEWLVDHMVATFGVAAVSVRLYLATLAFVVEGDTVRQRTTSDPWTYPTSLTTARGTFAMGGRVRVLLAVTSDGLRGSGQAISQATAAALGLTPGDRRDFTTESGARVAVRWRPWSTTGPDLGSIRALLINVGAERGDDVVLTFDPSARTVEAERLPNDGDRLSRLGSLVGGTFSAAVLAASVGCDEGSLEVVLRRRGDDVVARWLQDDGSA